MKKLFYFITAIALMASCTKDPDAGKGGEEGGDGYDQALEFISSIAPVKPVKDTTGYSEPVVVSDNYYNDTYKDPISNIEFKNVRVVVREREVDATVNSDDFVMMDSWGQIAWPGCLVRGDVKNGYKPTAVPIFKERQPFRLNINVVNGDENTQNMSDVIDFSSIPYPSSGYAIEAINRMMSKYVTNCQDEYTLPAKISFSINHVQSYEEIAHKIGLDMKAGSIASMKGEFGELNTSEKTYYMVNLVQSFFSIYHDGYNIDNVFNEDITERILKPYIYVNSYSYPLAYVSEVIYGRRYILLYEVEGTKHQIENALNAAFSYGKIGVSGSYSQEQEKVFQSMQAKVFMLGGGYAAEGLEAATNPAKVMEYIKKASFTKDNPPAPIGMIINDIPGNNIISSVSTSKYKITEVSYVPEARSNEVYLYFKDWSCNWSGKGYGQARLLSLKVDKFKINTDETVLVKEVAIKPEYNMMPDYGTLLTPVHFTVGEPGGKVEYGFTVEAHYHVISKKKPFIGSVKVDNDIVTTAARFIYIPNKDAWEVRIIGDGSNITVPFETLGTKKRGKETKVDWTFRLGYYVFAEGRVHGLSDVVKIGKEE